MLYFIVFLSSVYLYIHKHSMYVCIYTYTGNSRTKNL
uniref:Uncharacterized protein n=1 Tax=Anguilla anguilla TaxID=7936 RepID=A0A0E9R259_ANGAN